MDKNLFMRRVISGLLLGLLLLFIFGFSAQEGEESGALSAMVVEWLNAALCVAGLSLRLSQHIVRKAAHFMEYAILGALLLINLRVWTETYRQHVGWVFFFGLFISVLDEFHQTFVPGRAGMVSDVVLDFFGTLAGIGMCLLFWRALERRKIRY